MILVFKRTGNKIKLTAFVDASYGVRSISSLVIYLNKCMINWISRRQRCVTLSTCESEYVALALCIQEIMWLRSLLGELGFIQDEATTVYEDNRACIALAESEQVNSKSKHINIRLHFIKELIVSGVIKLEYLETKKMTLFGADCGTKAVIGENYIQWRSQNLK